MFSGKTTTEISSNKIQINYFLIMVLFGFGFSIDSLRNCITLNHSNSSKDASQELVIFEIVFFLIVSTISLILSKIKAPKIGYFPKEMIFYLLATLFICLDVEINLYIDILSKYDYFQKGVKYIFLEHMMQKVYIFNSIKMLSLFTHFFYLSMRMINFKEDPLVIVSLFFNYLCWVFMIFNQSKKVDHEVYSEFKSGLLKQRFTKTKSKISKKSASSSKEILEKPNILEENLLPKVHFDLLLNKSNDCCIIFDENNTIKYENKKAKLFFSDENNKSIQFFKKDKTQTLNFMENSVFEKNNDFNTGQSLVINNKFMIIHHLANLREMKSKIIDLKIEPDSNYKIIYNKWITIKEKIEIELNINDSKSSSLDSKKLFSASPGLRVAKKIKKYNFLAKKTFILKLFLDVQKNHEDIICFFHDISAEKSVANLMMIIENKSKAISFVSHEIRTPLNCIMNMLKLMEDKIDEESYYNFIKPAENSATFLLNLVNDLLDMAQIEAGKFKVNNIEFDLKVLLSDVLTLIKLQAESRKIELQLSYDSKLPETIKSDPNRIKQIIINLLGNALKFTTKGTIKIRAKLLKNQRFIKISVQDTGIGIKEEDKKRLFQAFGRLDLGENEKLNIQGVGLGLLISNSLSKNLGPQENPEYQGLQVKSNYGEGTKFYFVIDDKNEENYRMMDFDEEEKMPNQNIQELYKNYAKSFKALPSSSLKSKEGELVINQSIKKRSNKKNSTEHLPSPTHSQNDNHLLSSKMSKSDVLSESKKLLTMQKTFDENFLKEVFLNKKMMRRNQLITEFFCTNHMSSKLTMDFKEVEEAMNMIVKRNKAKNCECFDLLICDDNDFNILPLKYLLEGLHFKVDSCFSGQEAIVKVQKNYEENNCCPFYGIIFMDVEMPSKNGKEATKEILEFLADKREKKQTIIGCTGYSLEKEKNECLKSGMDSVMTKPITKGVLMKNLAKYFQLDQFSSIVLKEDPEICIKEDT